MMQPKGEKLKNAVKFISEKRKDKPDMTAGELNQLVSEASLQFDLSPKDEQFLLRFVKDDDHQDTA